MTPPWHRNEAHADAWPGRFGAPALRCQKRRLCAIRVLRAVLGRRKYYGGDMPLVAQRATTCRRRAQILKGQSGSGAVDFVVFCKCTLPAGMAVYRWSCNVCTWGDAGGGVASFRECLLQRVTKTPSVSPSCSGACGAGHCCMASASPFGFWNASARKPGRNTCCALSGDGCMTWRSGATRWGFMGDAPPRGTRWALAAVGWVLCDLRCFWSLALVG